MAGSPNLGTCLALPASPPLVSMSDRSSARKLTIVIGAIVALIFVFFMFTLVFEGCNEGGVQADQDVTWLAPPAPATPLA